MTKIRFEDRELNQLRIDLSGAPLRMQVNGGRAMRRVAKVIDRQMVIDATGHQGNYFGLPGTEFDTPMEKHVSHEMTGPLSAEIGIEYKGAGMLAHILVFGSVNNDPVYDHMAGPRRAMPTVERLIADAAEESVLGKDKS